MNTYPLTTNQRAALVCLVSMERATPQELAHQTGLTVAAVKSALKSLDAKAELARPITTKR